MKDKLFRMFPVDCLWLDAGDTLVSRSNDLEKNRTQFKAVKYFGDTFVFADVGDEYPILSAKRVPFKTMIAELCWFVQGRNDIKFLHDRKCSIWDEWVKPNRTIGPGYGPQWRGKNGSSFKVDQLFEVCKTIIENPSDRRMIVSAWNPNDLSEMALPPCHMMMQFDVDDGKLNLLYYQRSCDLYLGVPFNIASYAALLITIANLCGLTPGNLICSMGNVHLYENQIEPFNTIADSALKAQNDSFELSDTMEPEEFNQLCLDSPKLHFKPRVFKCDDKLEWIRYQLDNLDVDQFTLENYNPLPEIKVEVAV